MAGEVPAVLVEHRPRCQTRDARVSTTATTVGGTRWLMHCCDECGSVALVPTPADGAS